MGVPTLAVGGVFSVFSIPDQGVPKKGKVGPRILMGPAG